MILDFQSVSRNKVVSVAFVLKGDDGEVYDQADALEPLEYLHGHDNLLPSVEANMEGARKGDVRAFSIEAADGYGERIPGNTQVFPRKDLPPGLELDIGEPVWVETDHGPMPLFVSVLTDDEVTFDLNHPLAGKRLHFEMTVLAIRDAHPVEIEHGHVHSGGDHSHH